MDITKQSRLYLSPPHTTGEEFALVKEALASGWIAPVGPMIDSFEQEFAETVGISHALAVNSGTAAIHVGLRCLGVQPSDLVLVPTLTFVASVAPAIYLGAIPIF